MTIDEKYMSLAIRLAKKGLGRTSPNPAVGAVIVKRGRVVGSGYHKRCGGPHAEVNALRAAGRSAKGATMYVTLEPCNHYGRTPPCAGAIIKSGIARVVVAMKDPNPVTDGAGLRKLRSAGIRTEVGLLGDKAAELNRPFIKRMRKGLPHVTLKIAESIDGKIATAAGDSRWITSEDSRAYVQRLRQGSDAVMVGVNTVIKDDPMLLARGRRKGARQPARVIVDSRLRTPLGARILRSSGVSPVFIAALRGSTVERASRYAAKGATVIFAGPRKGRVDLRDLLGKLAGMGFVDILVEGGGELAAGLIEEGLADRALFFIAPKIIGGRDAVTSVEGRGARKLAQAVDLRNVRIRRFSKDFLIEADIGPTG